MLKVNDLHLERGGRALFINLSFELNKGEVLQILGRNGSGKSSLAAILAGDLKPQSGEVKYSNFELNIPNEMAKHLGVLFQNTEVDFAIAVKEYIQMANPKKSANGFIGKLRLEEFAEKPITKLSAGQLQRVQIAQLLHQDPEVLILDEPFSAQDNEHTELLINLFLELKRQGKTIILINHIDLDLKGLVDKTLNLG